MLNGNTPDLTPAQLVAVVTAVVTQLVNFGLLSGRVEHLVVGLAGILVPFAWIVGDAIIRHGRSRALAPTAAVVAPLPPKSAPPA